MVLLLPEAAEPSSSCSGSKRCLAVEAVLFDPEDVEAVDFELLEEVSDVS